MDRIDGLVTQSGACFGPSGDLYVLDRLARRIAVVDRKGLEAALREAIATVYAVDANAYFARPGPRVAEGVELLAHLFHPGKFSWPHEGKPWMEIG